MMLDYAPGWAPIMGAPFSNSLYDEVDQWSKGEYADLANNQEDDVLIIGGNRNGFGFKDDDYSDSISGTVGVLDTIGVDLLGATGLISRSNDIDIFRFASTDGAISLTVSTIGCGFIRLPARFEHSRCEFGRSSEFIRCVWRIDCRRHCGWHCFIRIDCHRDRLLRGSTISLSKGRVAVQTPLSDFLIMRASVNIRSSERYPFHRSRSLEVREILSKPILSSWGMSRLRPVMARTLVLPGWQMDR